MKKRTVAMIVFGGAVAASLLLYISTLSAVTVPVEALAAAHGFWAYWLDIFGGNALMMAAVFAALGVGLAAYLVCRYVGWYLAVSAGLVLTFLPPVWNSATRGGYRAFQFGVLMSVIWALDWLGYTVLSRVRKARAAAAAGHGTAATAEDEVVRRPSRGACLVGWLVLLAAAVVVVLSAAFHEYRYGEAEKVFEADIREVAAGRWIVESAGRDEAVRPELLSRVRETFPEDAELITAAQIGQGAFYQAALRKHPENFYLKLTGEYCEKVGDKVVPAGAEKRLKHWTDRWDDVETYLAAKDPFIPKMRRLFAYEGNAIGNALLASGATNAAWRLYHRIYTEIEPKNFSALVNMNEMVGGGYRPTESETEEVKTALEGVLEEKRELRHLRALVRASGPVRPNSASVAKVREVAEKRTEAVRKMFEEKREKGEPMPVSPKLKTLIEWNNEMVKHAGRGDLEKAGRVARTILANPEWRSFIPANAIMGSVVAKEGDLVASERFFRVAVGTTNAIPGAVMNDFAETLRRLKKFDEAEKWARKAVDAVGEKGWLPRLTLAEILKDAGKNPQEVENLLKAAEKAAPRATRKYVEEICVRIRSGK